MTHHPLSSPTVQTIVKMIVTLRTKIKPQMRIKILLAAKKKIASKVDGHKKKKKRGKKDVQ
jgi:hypothetical protein